MARFTFGEEDAQRIAGTVLRSEAAYRIPPGQHRAQEGLVGPRWFKFKNNSSETIPRGGVLRITGGTYTSREIILTVDKPNTTFRRIWPVNLGETVAAGKHGLCTFDSPVEVAYDSGTPAQDEGWGPKPSQWTVSLGYPSPGGVICVLDSTAKIMLANWGPINLLHGKADGDITARSGTTCGTGTMDIWYLSGSTLTDTTMSVTCKNNSSTKVTNGRYMQAKFAGGQWWADMESCA